MTPEEFEKFLEIATKHNVSNLNLDSDSMKVHVDFFMKDAHGSKELPITKSGYDDILFSAVGGPPNLGGPIDD